MNARPPASVEHSLHAAPTRRASGISRRAKPSSSRATTRTSCGSDAQPSTELLPGLYYLRNGCIHEIAAAGEALRVGGLGGCYGPSNFRRPSASLQGYAKRHYTQDEIESLSAAPTLDIVLTHEAPAGVRFPRHRRGEGFVSEAAGLDQVLARTRPRVCFFGHHHNRVDAEVEGVRCFGLNKGPYAGSLVAVEMQPGERSWRLLGEWPGPPKPG